MYLYQFRRRIVPLITSSSSLSASQQTSSFPSDFNSARKGSAVPPETSLELPALLSPRVSNSATVHSHVTRQVPLDPLSCCSTSSAVEFLDSTNWERNETGSEKRKKRNSCRWGLLLELLSCCSTSSEVEFLRTRPNCGTETRHRNQFCFVVEMRCGFNDDFEALCSTRLRFTLLGRSDGADDRSATLIRDRVPGRATPGLRGRYTGADRSDPRGRGLAPGPRVPAPPPSRGSAGARIHRAPRPTNQRPAGRTMLSGWRGVTDLDRRRRLPACSA